VYALATTRLAPRYSSNEAELLFLQPTITGWPESMHHTCTTAWELLDFILDGQEWIKVAFGSHDFSRSSVSAYYQLLSFLNFCHLAANDRLETDELTHVVTVPFCYCRWSADINKRGYLSFLVHRDLIKNLLNANNLMDEEKFERYWGNWMRITYGWLNNVYFMDARFMKLFQVSLPKDLINKGFSLKEA